MTSGHFDQLEEARRFAKGGGRFEARTGRKKSFHPRCAHVTCKPDERVDLKRRRMEATAVEADP